MWKVGLGSPKQRIDKEMGWHSKNINPLVHGVTRSKREGKAIAGTIKWYGRTNSQKAHWHRWTRLEDEGLCPSKAQSKEGIKGREYEPKSPRILHATRDKHQLERTAESNKHGDSKNGVKTKKKQIQTKWSMHKGLRHHLLVPSQYMGGGPQVKVFRGCGLAVGRKRGSILGFLLKLL